MDYSHAAYFSGSQPYQFIGIPPLTPSHSNSAASEEFNTTSPPVSPAPPAVEREDGRRSSSETIPSLYIARRASSAADLQLLFKQES